MGYANNTSVPIERTKTEIERTLMKYGADGFYYGTSGKGAVIGFRYKDRVIKEEIPLPRRDNFSSNCKGEIDQQREHRRLWRVELLWIKAALEKVDCGLQTFENVFLAQTCLPSGQTVSQVLEPQFQKMLSDGTMPKLLTE
ncbi:MAG: hypothetical protein WC356_02825 [Candidatus Micrarchaeia archaeon]|jgi:hypothetical protein